MTTTGDRSPTVAQLVRKELTLLILGAAYVLGALLIVVLVMRVLPVEVQSLIAIVTVCGGAFAAALLFSIFWKRRMFAFLLACAVAPTFIYLGFLLVPSEPDALDSLAYVFGSIYGFIAAALGVLISFAAKDRA